MKKTIAAVLGLSAVTAGTMFWLRRPEAPIAQVQTPVAAIAPAVVNSAPDVKRAPGCTFEVGQRLAYQVALTSKAEVELGSTALSAMPLPSNLALQASLKGQLDLQVVESHDDRAVLWVKATSLTGSTSLHPEEMNSPFLVEVNRACTMTRFARSVASPLRGARGQQALLWEGNYADPEASTATLTSSNGTGEYEAALTASRDASGALIEKQLTRYTDLWQRVDNTMETEGLTRVRPGAGPWFDTLDARERQQRKTQSQTVQLSLTRVEASPTNVVDTFDASGFIWENLLPKDFSQREPRAVTRFDIELRQKVANLTTEQALSTLTNAVNNHVGIERQWPALSAWLEVHPEKTGEIIATLKHEELDEAALNGYFIALGNARTPEARDALLDLKRSPAAPPMIRVRSMFSLVDRDDLDARFAQELATDSQGLGDATSESTRFIGSEALLAVTAMAGLKGDPATRDVAETAVKSALSSSTDNPHAMRVALKGLANLGNPELLPLVQGTSGPDDRRTREVAARAFRRMKPQDSNGMVLAWLKTEDDVLVRRRLYRTLEAQHFDQRETPVEAIARQIMVDLPKETSLMSRKAMIRLLARSEISQAPEVRALLKRQALFESKKGTGLLNELAEFLTPEEIREVVR